MCTHSIERFGRLSLYVLLSALSNKDEGNLGADTYMHTESLFVHHNYNASQTKPQTLAQKRNLRWIWFCQTTQAQYTFSHTHTHQQQCAIACTIH